MSFSNIIDMIVYNIYPKEITKTYMFLAIFNILNGYFFFSYIWMIVSFIPKFIIYCAVYEDFFTQFNFFKFLNSSFSEQLPIYIAFIARCFHI
jgi:hypothetical protein